LAFKISTRDAIINILLKVQEKYNCTYSQIKRSTIQNLLWKIYKIKRCLSTIDYHLGMLKKAGFMNIYRRRGQDEKGRWFNKVSNRQLLGKCFNYLIRSGKKVKKFLLDWAFKGIKPKRRKDKPHRLNDDNSIEQPSGRSVAQFETLENVLSDTLIRPI